MLWDPRVARSEILSRARAARQIQKEKGAETPSSSKLTGIGVSRLQLEGVLQGHSTAIDVVLVAVSILPHVFIEIKVDPAEFDAEGQILVDLVLGVEVDFPSLVGGGQVQAVTAVGQRSATMTNHFGVVGTLHEADAENVRQVFHEGDILRLQVHAHGAIVGQAEHKP